MMSRVTFLLVLVAAVVAVVLSVSPRSYANAHGLETQQDSERARTDGRRLEDLNSEPPPAVRYRPVYMNVYEKPPPLEYLRPLYAPYPILHTELEVDGREIGVLVPRNKKAVLRIRPDPGTNLHWPAATAVLIGFRFVCYSPATDSQIEQWLHEYRGEYCIATKNCNDFVDYLQERLCGRGLHDQYFVARKYLRTYPFLKWLVPKRDPEREYLIKEYQAHHEFKRGSSRARLGGSSSRKLSAEVTEEGENSTRNS